MSRRPQNTLGLVSANHAIMEIFLERLEIGQKVTAADFEAAKVKFYNKICIGLRCPALLSDECLGPKQNVEIVDEYPIMAAQAELKTSDPITQNTVDSLKCAPEIFGIV